MARTIKKHREYKFVIEAFSPETIPMARLAEYLTDLAVMLGNEKSVHFLRLESGSTVLVQSVEYEAEPKIRERIRQIKSKEAPERALEAVANLDKRLAEDNGRGNLIGPGGAKVLKFLGKDRTSLPLFGPVSQAGVFQGIPTKVGGDNDPVPIHLEDGNSKYIVLAKRSLAKEIAEYLFTNVVRVEGTGRWLRKGDGEWEMLSFTAHNVRPIEDADIKRNLSTLRSIDASWKQMDDPLEALERIRNRGKVQ